MKEYIWIGWSGEEETKTRGKEGYRKEQERRGQGWGGSGVRRREGGAEARPDWR